MPIPHCKRRIKKLQALARDPSADLWALDEVHFQQHGSRCRMWVPAELKDPILLHAPTRKSVGYFGAVRLRDGKLLTRQEARTRRVKIGTTKIELREIWCTRHFCTVKHDPSKASAIRTRTFTATRLTRLSTTKRTDGKRLNSATSNQMVRGTRPCSMRAWLTN